MISFFRSLFLAIGHLVGLSVGIAMLIGALHRLGLGRATLLGDCRRRYDRSSATRTEYLES